MAIILRTFEQWFNQSDEFKAELPVRRLHEVGNAALSNPGRRCRRCRGPANGIAGGNKACNAVLVGYPFSLAIVRDTGGRS